MESVKKFTNKGKDGIRRLMEHEESGWNIAVKCTVMVKKFGNERGLPIQLLFGRNPNIPNLTEHMFLI